MTAASAAGAPRFLCDEMLGRLGRYLRAAGYDTAIAAGGLPDAELLRQAREQQRIFLTLDRLILEHKAAAGTTLLLPRTDLDGLARALGDHCGIDWLGRAFTRCLEDNAPLEPADAARRLSLPPDLVDREARHCPVCGRLYWAGSHHARMRARLVAWQAARGEGGVVRTR